MKKIIFFVLAVGISFLGATYRWGDSAHSIGLIKASGGAARHPSYFESGKNNYTLISTATVIPPYSGDVRVVLEGSPELNYKLYDERVPIVNLGLHRWYRFRDNTFYGLQPKDRIALWVVIKPPPIDHVCGMAVSEGFVRYQYKGKDYYLCSDVCLSSFKNEPEKYKDITLKGKYDLVFYDTKRDMAVLKVPLVFKVKGEKADASSHH